MPSPVDDNPYMQRALELAKQGEGRVEPNPMVGAVVVRDGEVVGEGCHQHFGGPHAEVNALNSAGEQARDATLYVTLEPCCHVGKTPPCADAVIAAGVVRVVMATADPNPHVDGGGIRRLRNAGIECDVGVCEPEARDLLAPYLKLTTTGRPWVIAKWAMTLDGKIATHTGSSQWISSDDSRAVTHALRGRVDAIIVGAGTLRADDPLLTARPAGPRTATRVALGDVPKDSQLAATVADAPLMVIRSREPKLGEYDWLTCAGGEFLKIDPGDDITKIRQVLDEFGRRRMTNVLFEGGGQVLGALFDARAVDEVHAFVAPKIVGGTNAPSPVAGLGVSEMAVALRLEQVQIEPKGDDVYVRGRVK